MTKSGPSAKKNCANKTCTERRKGDKSFSYFKLYINQKLKF